VTGCLRYRRCSFFDGLCRGLPGGKSLSFASPKESNPRKGDPAVCVPSLRFGQPVVLSPAGVSCKLASLRQARSLIRLALRSSAHTEGLWGGTNAPRICFRQSRPGWAEERSRGRIKILDVRRRRSRLVSKISGPCEHRKEPRSGSDCGSPFFSLGFFGEAKKSNSPAGARPGLVVTGTAPIHLTARGVQK
jgi:hypothetical protein